MYVTPALLSGHFQWPCTALLSAWVRHFVFPVIVTDCCVAPLFSLFLRSSGRQLRNCAAQCVLLVLPLCLILPHTDTYYYCAANHIVLIFFRFDFHVPFVNSVLSSPPAVALGRTCIVAVNAVAVVGCGFYRGLCNCGVSVRAAAVVASAPLCTVLAVGLCTTVLLYFAISDMYRGLCYWTVRWTVRVALTVYATVVPLFCRICVLYVSFRKLWHLTIRVCTDVYRGLRYWTVRCTVCVASTVYATVCVASTVYATVVPLYFVFRKLWLLPILACSDVYLRAHWEALHPAAPAFDTNVRTTTAHTVVAQQVGCNDCGVSICALADFMAADQVHCRTFNLTRTPRCKHTVFRLSLTCSHDMPVTVSLLTLSTCCWCCTLVLH